MRWLDGITNSGHELGQTLGDGEGQGSLVKDKLQEMVKDSQPDMTW